MTGRSIIVMGVCGCGKSTIGENIANKLNAKFIDGDDLHPKANIQKMASGTPLEDIDRAPWLERIRDAAYSIETKNETGVIVCSALKKKYRDQIREGNKNVQFIFLDGSKSLILDRMRARQGHFMRETMLDSQLETLERPDQEVGVFTISIDGSIDNIVDAAVAVLVGNINE
ncbi:gluconokinase [Photobacterium kishitanii]|uniref:gluconokinase n=1 Tax=Photobacterium kishitanii TaxID=318456 RepID=UPI0004358B00|nr:gluconokinase [Photobacterium kishitanii]OBU25818.1 gluconate kinase [Photobacterium kishitanii]PSU91530.1 gluconokinase [Photobacterium kishitanii]PSV10888.1 gluconokinase [Photobacterium kishitanii]PSW68553.1 gluconokinase [Photobacterium kishitanii]CEO41590.1 D-gluconate kinase, thermosensitive [Photobacterium kishitanii]